MQGEFKPLDDESKYKDAVISFKTGILLKVGGLFSCAKDVFTNKGLEEMNKRLSHKGTLPTYKNEDNWSNSGIDCEILSPGAKGWQKGKVRIKVTLEFCPDEPEQDKYLLLT